MRLAADTLAPQASAVASRRRVAGGLACASGTFTWRTSSDLGFVGTKPSSSMVMIPVNKAHANGLTIRRLSEASP